MKKVPWENLEKSKLNINTQVVKKRHTSTSVKQNGNDQKQPLGNWKLFCKNGVLSCQVSILRILVDLFWTENLFSQKIFFLQYNLSEIKQVHSSRNSGAVLQEVNLEQAYFSRYSTAQLSTSIYQSTANSRLLVHQRKPLFSREASKHHKKYIDVPMSQKISRCPRKIGVSLSEYLTLPISIPDEEKK